MAKLIKGNLTDLLNAITGKKVAVCGDNFDDGAKKYISLLCEICPILYERIDCVTYNEVSGDTFSLGSGHTKPLYTYENFMRSRPCGTDYVMLFGDVNSIVSFFNHHMLPENVVFFSIDMILRLADYDLAAAKKQDAPLVPKLLHYIWFGGNALKPIHHKCLESWRNFCPDYEIIRWDEDSYDVTKHPYMHEAYKAKKWAFVSDYARLDILYHYGGIYLDTDVEIIKPLDSFLYDTGFCAMEHPWLVNTGLILGAAGEHPMLKALRDYYDGIPFINEDGSYNLTSCTTHQSLVLYHLGFKHNNNLQQLHGLTIYPMDVFAPMPPNLGFAAITDRTHTIHHYDSSWHDAEYVRAKYENVKSVRESLQSFCGDEIAPVPLPPLPDSLIQQMPPEMWHTIPEAADAIYSGNFEEAMTVLDEYLAESLQRGNAEDSEYILAVQLFAAALLGDNSLTRDIRTIRLELFAQTGQPEKAAREYSQLEKLCTASELEAVREMAGLRQL